MKVDGEDDEELVLHFTDGTTATADAVSSFLFHEKAKWGSHEDQPSRLLGAQNH